MLSDLKRFFKHSTIYAIANIVNRVGAFALLPLYTNYLTISQYGVLELFYSISAVSSTFVGIGLAHAVVRIYFDYDDEQDRKSIISTAFISSFFISITGVLLVSIWSTDLSLIIFSTPDYADTFYIVYTILVLEISIQISIAFFRIKEYSLLFIAVAVIKILIQISCNIYILTVLGLGVKGVLIGNLIAVSVEWMIVTFVTIRECGVGVDLTKLKVMVLYSYPLLGSRLIEALSLNADRFIMNAFFSTGSVGVYSLALKFAQAVRMLIRNPFQQSFGPFRFSIMNQKNAKEMYSKIVTYLLSAVTLSALTISLYSLDLLRLLSKPEFWDASKIVPIVMLAQCLGCLIYPFQTGILIKKKTKYIFYISMFSGTLKIGLFLLLIPSFGAYGAAIGLMILNAVIAFCTYSIAQKIYPIHYNESEWVKILLVGTFLYLGSLMYSFNSITTSVIVKVPHVILLLVFFYYLKIFSSKEVKVIKSFICNLRKRAFVNS